MSFFNMNRWKERRYSGPGKRSLIAILAATILASSLCSVDSPAQVVAESSPTEQPPVDLRLQLIGSLASSQIYTTFSYIGVVEDNARREIYTPQRLDDLLNEVAVLIDSVLAQMEQLQKTELTAEDERAVREIIEIYGLLNQTASALRSFTKEKSASHEQAYQKIRTETWSRVAKLLGIAPHEPQKQ